LKFAHGRCLQVKKDVLCRKLGYFKVLFAQPNVESLSLSINIAEEDLASERLYFLLWVTSEEDDDVLTYHTPKLIVPFLVLSNYYSLNLTDQDKLNQWATSELTEEFYELNIETFEQYWKRSYIHFEHLKALIYGRFLRKHLTKLVFEWLDGESCTTTEEIAEFYGSNDFNNAKKLLKTFKDCLPRDFKSMLQLASIYKVSSNALDLFEALSAIESSCLPKAVTELPSKTQAIGVSQQSSVRPTQTSLFAPTRRS
jgi:hypothetical protein